MRIVFWGSSELAVCALAALCQSAHQVLAVVTSVDKAKGRGRKVSFSPVKMFAQKRGLPVLQPGNLAEPDFLQRLRRMEPDLFTVAAYGKILPAELLRIPRKYAVNLHASLLPKYRGAAPINWAIIKGEKETGVSVFKMDEQMDRGSIILQRKLSVAPFDTAVTLGEKLAKLGAETLTASVDLIANERVTFSVQDKNQVSLAPKLRKEDGRIDWKNEAVQINNQIRGLQPWPGAFTYWQDKLLKICKAEIVAENSGHLPGQIANVDAHKGILVQTGKGQLLISELQLEGKRKIDAGEFIHGHKVEVGERLGEIKK